MTPRPSSTSLPGLADARRRRSNVGVIALALVAACSGLGGEVTETTASTGATAMPPATTATTAGPSTIPTTMATTTAAPPSTTMPDGPSGSGCTPGDTVALPEGEWYGVVVSASPSGIEFDLACWFTGEPAVEAAAEDGAEPPPNDYYVRNDNPQIRSLPVSSETEVVWYPTGDPASEVIVTFRGLGRRRDLERSPLRGVARRHRRRGPPHPGAMGPVRSLSLLA